MHTLLPPSLHQSCGHGSMHVTHIQMSDEDKNILVAKKIDTKIREIGLTRQQFAQLMDVQPSSVTKWLSGSHNFTLQTVYSIERKLGLSLLDLSSCYHISTVYSFHISPGDLPLSNSANFLNSFRQVNRDNVKIVVDDTSHYFTFTKLLHSNASSDESPNVEFLGAIKNSKNR
jgi:transcriptional regulator with XRE-family HTH domain